jgi:hypothetical protein
MPEDQELCAYCATVGLTGREKPEHPIPAALGASLKVRTVCKDCNEWAGTAIDQPLLADQVLRERRSIVDQRDPRRARQRRQPSTFLRGYSEDGDFFSYDHETKRPVMGSRIVDLGDNRYQIRAGSQEEAERLMAIMRARAVAEDKAIEVVETERSRTRPTIQASVLMDAIVWRRAAAKMGLGVGSLVFDAGWRETEDAHRLREWMHDRDPRTEDGTAPPLVPRTTEDLRGLAWGDAHRLWFTRLGDNWIYLSVVLFGALIFAVPVNSTDAQVPPQAWILDWRHPKRDGLTTWDEMLMAAVLDGGSLDPAS